MSTVAERTRKRRGIGPGLDRGRDAAGAAVTPRSLVLGLETGTARRRRVASEVDLATKDETTLTTSTFRRKSGNGRKISTKKRKAK
jgi:hypothetical protein